MTGQACYQSRAQQLDRHATRVELNNWTGMVAEESSYDWTGMLPEESSTIGQAW